MLIIYACPLGDGVVDGGFCVVTLVSYGFGVVRKTDFLEKSTPLYEGLFDIIVWI